MPVSKPPETKKVRRDVELDETDQEILRVLAADARTPNNVLAAHVGLAASTCLMRVRRLRDTGVIRGFHADLAPEALGRPLQAIVAVRLQPNARPGIGSFARRFAALPGVLNVFFLAGVDDFQIHLAARSADDLRDFVVKNLSASRDVASTETNLIFEHIQGTILTATNASSRTSRGATSGLRRDQRLAHVLLRFGGREEIPERLSDLGAYRPPGDDHADHGHRRVGVSAGPRRHTLAGTCPPRRCRAGIPAACRERWRPLTRSLRWDTR
jgi:DNA-binding Lrp family transcriptional regulator